MDEIYFLQDSFLLTFCKDRGSIKHLFSSVRFLSFVVAYIYIYITHVMSITAELNCDTETSVDLGLETC